MIGLLFPTRGPLPNLPAGCSPFFGYQRLISRLHFEKQMWGFASVIIVAYVHTIQARILSSGHLEHLRRQCPMSHGPRKNTRTPISSLFKPINFNRKNTSMLRRIHHEIDHILRHNLPLAGLLGRGKRYARSS